MAEAKKPCVDHSWLQEALRAVKERLQHKRLKQHSGKNLLFPALNMLQVSTSKLVETVQKAIQMLIFIIRFSIFPSVFGSYFQIIAFVFRFCTMSHPLLQTRYSVYCVLLIVTQGQGHSQINLSQRRMASKGSPSWFNERPEVILGQVPCLGTTC